MAAPDLSSAPATSTLPFALDNGGNGSGEDRRVQGIGRRPEIAERNVELPSEQEQPGSQSSTLAGVIDSPRHLAQFSGNPSLAFIKSLLRR